MPVSSSTPSLCTPSFAKKSLHDKTFSSLLGLEQASSLVNAFLFGVRLFKALLVVSVSATSR